MKRIKELYNKVLDLIDNENIIYIIKSSVIISRNIFIVLILILLGFIFIPSFEWGWLDRNTMISSLCTIIGGLFGLIAGIIGIVGTYGAFYLGERREREKEINYKRTMLANLLDYTIVCGHDIYENLNEIYKSYHSSLEKRGVKLNELIASDCDTDINSIKLELNNDINYIYECLYKKSGKSEKELQILEDKLDEKFNSIIVNEIQKFKPIYDENWCSYLSCLEEFAYDTPYRDMQRVIRWILFHKNIDKEERYMCRDFIMSRNDIESIIDILNKDIKNQGFRGTSGYKELRE